MIAVDTVSKWYGTHRVLTDCSTTVARGEIVVVCGPSGSGKSTLIKCINGLERFDRGSILVDGVSVGAPDTNLARLRARIGMVFQHFELYPHLTVTQNITLAPMKALKRSRAEAASRATALLDQVGLRDFADRYPSSLSGGQQQRVAIARALAMQPLALLCDEITSALDPELVNEVLAVVRELAAEGMTLLMVTHEMRFARDVCSRVVFMHQGRVHEIGPPAEVFGQPKTPELQQFLGVH